MHTALLLLEIQNDYFPNGRIPLEKSVEACSKVQNVLQAFREKKYPIIHVQHISTQPNASYFLPCTKGADFHPSMQPLKNETIIKKHYPNSFKDTSLTHHLTKHHIRRLVICGNMTHMAIDATVRAGADLGLTLTVLHDGCTARQLEFNNSHVSAQHVHYAFLAALAPHYATIVSTEEYLHKLNSRLSFEAA